MPMFSDNARGLAAALIVTALLIAALVLGKEVLIPFALAIVFAFILAPIVRVIAERGAPRGAAVALVMVVAVAVLGGASYAFSSQILTLTTTLATHKDNLSRKIQSITGSNTSDGALKRAQQSLEILEKEVERNTQAAIPPAKPAGSGAVVVTQEAKAPPTSLLAQLKRIFGPLATAGLTLLFTGFLLSQHNDIRDRVVRIAGVDNMSTTTSALSDAGSRLSKLFLTQAILNAGFGIFVAIALSLIGVPNAVLWGVSTACLRFVPFIGSFLSAIPPILLAAAVDPGWTMVIATAALFAIGEPILGHVVEPYVLGKHAGLSAFAMVLAASFWTLVWGPVGLLLAAPITMALVVLGQYIPRLEFLSVLLGDAPALSPAQEFYHRMLSADAPAAVEQIDTAMGAQSLPVASDEIVLPALRIAARDYRLETLTAAQTQTLRDTLDSVIELVEAEQGEGAAQPQPDGAGVLIVPARGPIDAAASKYVADLVQRTTGRPATAVTSSTGLMAISDARQAAKDRPVSHVVISTVGGLDDQHLKLILRRASRDFPAATLVVCNWGVERQPNQPLGGRDSLAMTRVADLIHHVSANHGASAENKRAAEENAPLPQPQPESAPVTTKIDLSGTALALQR